MNVGIGWRIIFNNTGVDWVEIQHEVKKYVEKQVLHCITDKFYESQEAPVICTIDDVAMRLYFRVNSKELVIECIAVRANHELPSVDEE